MEKLDIIVTITKPINFGLGFSKILFKIQKSFIFKKKGAIGVVGILLDAIKLSHSLSDFPKYVAKGIFILIDNIMLEQINDLVERIERVKTVFGHRLERGETTPHALHSEVLFQPIGKSMVKIN